MEIRKNVQDFMKWVGHEERDASFDYCFNYFQGFRDRGDIAGIAAPEKLEQSCLQLGFYLASFGMYRGSTALFQKSSKFLDSTIELIAATEMSFWDIDADSYDERAEELCSFDTKLYDTYTFRTSGAFNMSDTLRSKIMMGVFGSVPAFDSVFTQGAKTLQMKPGFNLKNLKLLGDFYKNNADEIEGLRSPTLNFKSGQPGMRRYTRARIIDMALFQEGERRLVAEGSISSVLKSQ